MASPHLPTGHSAPLFPYEQTILQIALVLIIYATSAAGLYTGNAYEEYRTLGYVTTADSVADQLPWIGTIATAAAIFLAPVVVLLPGRLSAPVLGFLIFLGFVVVSGLWSNSITANLVLSLKTLLYGLAVVVISRRITSASLLTALIGAALLIGGSSFYLAFTDEIFRQTLGAAGWRGLFVHKNHLGGWVLFMIVLLHPFVLLTRGTMRRLALITEVVLAILLILSNSKTGLGLAVAYVGATTALMRMRTVSWRSLFLEVCFFWTVGAVMILPALVDQITSQQITFTGRTEIWAYFLQDWLQRPLFGSGSYTLPLDEYYTQKAQAQVNAAGPDSSYVFILINTGIVGLLLYLGVVGVFFRHLYLHASKYSLCALCGLLVYLSYGAMETGSQLGLRFQTMVILIQAALAARSSMRAVATGKSPIRAVARSRGGPRRSSVPLRERA